MMKKYISGVLLLGLSIYLAGFLFDKVLKYSESKISNNYFRSRTDNSYNVHVEIIKDKIKVSGNNVIREFDLKSIIRKLESAEKHRLLDIILKKIRSRSSFNLKANHKLNICGFYHENIYFQQAFVFKGDINNLDLFDFITDPKIKWPTNKGDDDLILIIVHLFVKKFFNFYTFKFYNEFFIISDYLQQDLCRVDIDYASVFGIKPKSPAENSIICELTRVDNGIIVKKVNESSFHTIQEIDPDQNRMSNTLKKNCTLEIDLETLLYENKLEEIKNILDVNKIKGDKKFMDFVKKIKEINEVKKVFESDVQKEDKKEKDV